MISTESIKASFDNVCSAHVDAQAVNLTPAAVLIGLVPSNDVTGMSILLTTRTQHLHHHPGQISLPGGRVDQGDETPIHTALRETQEEVGIEPSQVSILGELPVYKSVTGFIITPIVGSIAQDYTLAPDPFEVDEVFKVPLSHVLNPRNHEKVLRDKVVAVNASLEQRDFYFQINYGKKRIWGVTAGILVSFYKRLRDKHPLFCEVVHQFESQ